MGQMYVYRLFLLLCFWLIAFTTQAQNLSFAKEDQHIWGIAFAGSVTNAGYIKPFSRNSTLGYKVGAFSTHRINTAYELSLNLVLTRIGENSFYSYRFTSPTLDTTIYSKYKDVFTYVNLQPQLRYYPALRGKIKPYVAVSVFGGYLLGAKSHLYTGDNKYLGGQRTTQSYYKLNYGVSVDIGIKVYPTKYKSPLWISVSYEPGIANIMKYSSGTGIGRSAIKTNAYSLNLFYPILN